MSSGSSGSPVFIWRDKNVSNSFNSDIFGSSAKDVYYASSTSTAIKLLNKYKNTHTVYVITNGGDNAEQFVIKVRYQLNIKTELVVFCSAVSYHKSWASKYNKVIVLNGKLNLQKWVTKIKNQHKTISAITYFKRALKLKDNYDIKNNDNDDDELKLNQNMNYNMNKSVLKEKDFKISNVSYLKLGNNLKSKKITDESGYNVIPITSNPIISLKLNISYDAWNKYMQIDFLTKLSKNLGVKPDELTIICKNRGSIELSVLVNAVINQFNGVPITCAYIKEKTKSLQNAPQLKSYCITSAKIKDWFSNKLNDNTVMITQNTMNSSINSSFGLSQSEKWIINQTNALKSSLEIALDKLNSKFVVTAICMLDNDDAFKRFIQHSNIEKSRLLFHGTKLEVLGSIYQTGLKHQGGAVYGIGSYLTSSPLHSINYMICYKSGQTSNNEYTLIAAYVNCGKIKQIYDMSQNQKQIQYPYDSHYIAKVGSAPNRKYLGYTMDYIKQKHNVSYTDATADEYAIKDASRILPRFYISFSKVDDNLNGYTKYVDFVKRSYYHSNSLCFQYDISHLGGHNDWTQRIKGQHMQNYGNFTKKANDMKIHPILYREAYINKGDFFDTRGYECKFEDIYHFIGPLNLKQKYVSPKGWTRYGLNVMNKYSDNVWLHPFSKNNNNLWWRAFHGTINAKKFNFSPLDAMINIYKTGFKVGTECILGKGVYCSPDPNIIEKHGYCGIAVIEVKNDDKPKAFKFMLQVAVKPSVNTLSVKSNALYWCVLNANDIRPYGILIKEIPYKEQYKNYDVSPTGMDALLSIGLLK